MNHSQKESSKITYVFKTIQRWLDSESGLDNYPTDDVKRVDWLRITPFIILHLMCIGVVWVGWSWTSVGVAIFLYVIRMFAITGWYHRYFSHKTFKTGRIWQFIFAVIGNASVQRGPLWWSSHHRHHHRFADKKEDVHSPAQHGFLWSHMGWLTSPSNFFTRKKYVADWLKFPELCWINRYDTVVPILLAVFLFILGTFLNQYVPSLNTNGPQMLIWGFFISSTVLFHATVSINSIDHMYGTRRYATQDTSRNNPLLAIITLGEGWHNNHHHYAVSTRQGFFWWEIDMTYYLLVFMSWFGIVKNLRQVPDHIKNQHEK